MARHRPCHGVYARAIQRSIPGIACAVGRTARYVGAGRAIDKGNLLGVLAIGLLLLVAADVVLGFAQGIPTAAVGGSCAVQAHGPHLSGSVPRMREAEPWLPIEIPSTPRYNFTQISDG